MKHLPLQLSFLLILFGACLAPAQTPSAIMLSSPKEVGNVGKQVYFLAEKQQQYTIESLQLPAVRAKFKKSEQNILQFGYNEQTYWFFMDVRQASLVDDNWFLVVDDGAIQELEMFYEVRGAWQSQKAGFTVPIHQKPLYHHLQVFDLRGILRKNQPVRLYFRLKNNSVPLPISLVHASVFYAQQKQRDFACFILVGFWLFIVVNNFIAYLNSRDSKYLHYSIFILSIAGLSIATNDYQAYFGDLGLYTHRIFAPMGALTIFLGATYGYYFLETRRYAPFLVLYSKIVFAYFFLALLYSPFMSYSGAFLSVQMNALLSLVNALITGIVIYRRGNPLAKIYIGAYFLFLVFVLLELSYANFDFPHVLPFTYTDVAFMCETILLAYALNRKTADEKRELQEEKEKAQAEALQKTQENERLLKEQNQLLEDRVLEKTRELQAAYDDLQVTNEELNSTVEELSVTLEAVNEQKKIIDLHNKRIMESLHYAEAIQRNILPTAALMQKFFLEYFVIYRPKDVVSGDFYWLNPLQDAPKKFVIAVGDCTGHGVVGAFTSLVSVNLLEHLCHHETAHNPAWVLEQVDAGFEQAMKQRERQSYLEGMEVALAYVEELEGEQYRVVFAGARQALYYTIGDEWQTLGHSRRAIGSDIKDVPFSQTEIIVPKGTRFYMMTDGFKDQNNRRRQKFGFPKLQKNIMHLHQSHVDVHSQRTHLEEALHEHQQDEPQRDDITLLGFVL